jgi:carbamoyl-phosphate synthase large subunit
MNILVTGAGAPGFPGIVRSLRRNGERKIRIIGTDMQEDVVGFHLADTHYVVPSGNHAAYMDAILKIVAREAIDMVLPLCTFELLPLSEARRDIEAEGAKVAVSRPQPLMKAISKARTYQHLTGDFVPKHRVVHSPSEFKTAVETFGYPTTPVVFKPSLSHGMRGFRVINDHANLLFHHKPQDTVISMADATVMLQGEAFPELVVMEYLPGPEYSVDVLSKDGHIYYAVARRRIATRRGISYVGRVEKHDALEAVSRDIVAHLGLDYNINLQFKVAEDGGYKLIEVNPRVSGSIVFCVAAGVNLPYFAVKLALDEGVPIVPIRYGTTIYRHWTEVITPS